MQPWYKWWILYRSGRYELHYCDDMLCCGYSDCLYRHSRIYPVLSIFGCYWQLVSDHKAKQPESGNLCGNITEFGVAEGSPELAGWRWSFRQPKRSDIAIQYTRRRLFSFYILLFNGFKSFQAKTYEINMYLLLYFIFLNHSVGIHPTATQKSHEQHSNAIHVTSWRLMTP